MYHPYFDIRNRLGEPLWHDKNGVPRYDEFTPQQACFVYGDWVLYFTVKCASCGQEFKVATSVALMEWFKHQYLNKIDVSNDGLEDFKTNPQVAMGWLDCWGDAPWHEYNGGQCAGTTMSVDDGEYISLWRKELCKWVQVEIPKEQN